MDAKQKMMMAVALMLEDQCFTRWVRGGEWRRGNNFKEHCITYFQPNITATEFLERTRREIPGAGEGPHELYLAVLQAERMQFESYTDEQANDVLRLWKESKGNSDAV